ncbi:hypothetical protein E9536_38670 [Burkholderia sp. LS-044]|nr:hypothetical protein E9536_38670 [Burkholderia sp. LS-044]
MRDEVRRQRHQGETRNADAGSGAARAERTGAVPARKRSIHVDLHSLNGRHARPLVEGSLD